MRRVCVCADMLCVVVWRTQASWLSEALRSRTRQRKPDDAIAVIVYDYDKAVAYAAHRMCGVFSCVTRVLAELRCGTRSVSCAAHRRAQAAPTRLCAARRAGLRLGTGHGAAGH